MSALLTPYPSLALPPPPPWGGSGGRRGRRSLRGAGALPERIMVFDEAGSQVTDVLGCAIP